LPLARLNALAGLVEKLATEGGRADIYRLGGELILELDDLLPIVEAGEVMGLLTVQEGDIFLTPLGEAYAAGSILTRKELVASRILRLPTIRWIYEVLQNDDDRRVDRDYFLDILRADLGDEADRQLDIAVNWGRYAELFAYDQASDELYLES
ncbi:MAG TPA: AAA-associated domain-containing protein, partial [Thermoanaerobaculia bacterium]|nr:AAA-associated domain-containing protein [Thermoanaerobaculia bacterium]